MRTPICRSELLPESDLPSCAELLDRGRALASETPLGRCAFLDHYAVESEAAYKRRCMAESKLMLHAQIGYRSLAKSKRAAREIHQRLSARGCRVDRYGICLDWSMGYPREHRRHMPRGTGLILEAPEAFAELTASAPVAPHFGDFCIGTPAAVENVSAALAAGATTVGNLGQYFTFRQPRWNDDVYTTAETVKALSLIAAWPVEVVVHSNLDDGFAATFTDLACAAGMVLVEQYIVSGLLGAPIAHCYGHTFSDPMTRFAFQRVLAGVSDAPGSMVYGNTTSYGDNRIANYASLAAYLLVDIAAQSSRPTGHALNPVPVSEAERIPDIEEIVDAHLFAHDLLARTGNALNASVKANDAEALSVRLVAAGERFKSRLLEGLEAAGIDVRNSFELLLAIRRLGARRLESLFGPAAEPDAARQTPVARSPYRDTLDSMTQRCLSEIDTATAECLRGAGLTACTASSDVHEYGKLLIENLLCAMHVSVVDAGVSVDPEALAAIAHESGADFIALSTYNGVALSYVQELMSALEQSGARIAVFIGGKLNQIPEASNSAIPVDVSAEIAAAGAVPCPTPSDMLARLTELSQASR
jgi:methylmalonyl-CoA mutase cobalamin-binding subunit